MIEIVMGLLLLGLIIVVYSNFNFKKNQYNLAFQKKELEIENKHILVINQKLIDDNHKYSERLQNLQQDCNKLSANNRYYENLVASLQEKLQQSEQICESQRISLSKQEVLAFELDNLRTIHLELEKKLSAQTLELSTLNATYQKTLSDLRILEQQNKLLEKNIADQKLNFEETNLRIKAEIQTLSKQIFQESSQQNNELLNTTLAPLKEQIFQFNEKLQFQHHEQIRYTNTLNEKIKEIVQQTDYTSKIAENLSNALKGDTKFQGDWGEMILENILQNAGLEENREYYTQSNFKNESNDNIRPDIIVQLPGERVIVIDSKVSLTAYERFCNEKDNVLVEKHLEDHVKSIKNHITILSNKEYNQISGSLDFVLLFIPIESAYVVALKKDPELWNLAYQKKILLMSPTNLIAAIKLIADLWKREYQHKNSLKIAALAEKMHAKLVHFLNQFDEIGIQIQKSQNQFINAQKILLTGRGNLSNQLNQLKQMGINSKNLIKNDLYLVDDDSVDGTEIIENN